jgi:hypothetical protein
MKKKVNRRLWSNHLFFFMTPGPKIGPQKNIGTPPEAGKLAMSNGLLQNTGLKKHQP